MKFTKKRLAFAILAFALLLPGLAVAVSPFVDVVPGKFYEAPVNWAFDNGITTGKDATHFDPNGAVTRGESVTFLKRYNDNIVGKTLGQLSCSTDQVAHWNGSAWVCSTVGLSRTLSTASITTPDNVNNFSVSLAIGTDGLPVISSWRNSSSLGVFHCTDKDCATGTATQLQTVTISNQPTSIAIGSDGFPVVAYTPMSGPSVSTGELRLMHCSNIACTSGTASVLDTTGNTGSSPSIAIGSDGRPIIAYVEVNNHDLKLFRCSNIVCSTGSVTPLDTASLVNATRAVAAAVGSDGFPFIVYADLSTNTARIIHCTDVACTSPAPTPTTLATGGIFQYFAVAIGPDGLPIITYTGNTSKKLEVHHCSNLACTSGTTTTIDPGVVPGVHYSSSIVIGIDGLPVIAWDDQFSNLKVHHCADVTCSSGSTLTVDNPVTGQAMAIAPDGSPTIAIGGSTLQVVRLDMTPTGIAFG